MKEQKGITLIALVITIIVLLILAGVSIAMLTGQNGILTQANNAKTTSVKADAVERINLALNAAKAEFMADSTTTIAEMATIINADLNGETGYTVDSTTDTSKVTITHTSGATGSITSAGVVDPAEK